MHDGMFLIKKLDYKTRSKKMCCYKGYACDCQGYSKQDSTEEYATIYPTLCKCGHYRSCHTSLKKEDPK